MHFLGMLRTGLAASVFCGMAMGASAISGSFLVTNDDLPVPFISTVTFFPVNADGTLGAKVSLATQGNGIGGGYFAAPRVIVPAGGTCVYASNAGSGDIAGIDAATQAVVGNYFGSPTDSGTGNGIGLAGNAQYVYASYSTSSTIGTFQVQTGCALSFVGDVFTAGLNAGTVDGMAINGNLMVVTYGDGSIESFNIAGGVPVSNGDAQYSTGSENDNLPNGVIITHGGRFAIFGDASTRTTVEVSAITGGKLSPTVSYDLGATWNSGNVRLSPDEKVLFVSNDSAGQVTAAFFDMTSGAIHAGCTSPALKGYYTKFAYIGNIGLQTTTLGGGVIYVPEFSSTGRSYVGMLNFTPNVTTCTIAEAAGSPVNGAASTTVMSLAVSPSAQ